METRPVGALLRRLPRQRLIGLGVILCMLIGFFVTSQILAYPSRAFAAGNVQINAGGAAVAPFSADTDFSGGTTAGTANTIDTSGVTNPAPQAVYQSNRYGNFTYTVPALTAGATYTVRLHFAETYWTAAGKRVFNVSINSQPALTNFDIVVAAGSINKAVVEQASATASASGAITIQFTSVTDQAQVNGIEVLGGSTPTNTPTASGSAQINSGGPAVAPFVADTDFTGGATSATGNTINTSGVSNPAPQAVYQSNRYGNFTYTIPGLTANAAYTVRLHFAETYWTATGKRTFNVSINSQQVLTNFDIVAAAGAANKAVVESLNATASASGAITIQFTSVVDNAQVNGIEVLGGGSSATPTPTSTATSVVPTPTTISGTPNFGPNVYIFDPSMSATTIQNTLTTLYNQQVNNQFGTQRYALLFKPGTYNVSANLGFYEQALGLGLLPDAVNINGFVDARANLANGNATQVFWRGVENMEITTPNNGWDVWAVAQGADFRRMDVHGNLMFWDGGWASGGFMADSNVTGQTQSGSQQQWMTRNSNVGTWSGGVWNMVFVGDQNAPAASFPNPPETVVNQTPSVREKPFLYVDGAGNYNVFVPGMQTNSQGTTWAGGNPAGKSLPINQFYIAHPGDSAATINNALAQGLNLLFTPGVYPLSSTINVTRANTVVLGLGLATLVPQNGVTSMSVADVDGVSIAGLLFDAGTTNSSALLQVGPAGSTADHTANPTVLSDVHFRIGGPDVGKATQSLVVNSNNVIGDNNWLWRADHGTGVGWTVNTAANGLVVNGNNVIMYGLAVEHYQQYEVLWNGNGGRTYFFQNEMPYDPPNQAAWMNGSIDGYAAYKVANTVTSHQAWGVGSYCYFNVNPAIIGYHAFEVPNTPGVAFHDLVTVSLGGVGTITHVINDTGGPSNSTTNNAYLTSYP